MSQPGRTGGPRWIRPFREGKVVQIKAGEEAQLEWHSIPFPPPLSSARVLYAVDVFFLRRAGTSPLLASQGRALEWSFFLRRSKKQPHQVDRHDPVRRFGQTETSLLRSALQLLLLSSGIYWLYQLASPPSPTVCLFGIYIPTTKSHTSHLLRSLPLARKCISPPRLPSFFDSALTSQLLITAVIGSAVCFGFAFFEALLPRSKVATSFLASFDQPAFSPSISHMWARGWHGYSQRDYTNLASFCPYGRTKKGRLLWSFTWSAVQHSVMFCRLRTAPLFSNPRSLISTIYDRGMFVFFLSQAVGILIERAVLDAIRNTLWPKRHKGFIAVARKVWFLTVLLAPGRYFVDSILSKGLMTKPILDGFAPGTLWKMIKGSAY